MPNYSPPTPQPRNALAPPSANTLNAYEQVLPLQLRTLLSMTRGETAPLTEKDLSPRELARMSEAIEAARVNRRHTYDELDKYPDREVPAPHPGKALFDQMRTPETREHFLGGGGTVQYSDYPGGEGSSDFDMTPGGSIRNTLGRFAYTTLPDGRVVVTDSYGFRGDLSPEMAKHGFIMPPKESYKGLQTADLLGKLFKDTYLPSGGKKGFWDSIGAGLGTLQSRIGLAAQGDTPDRPVRIMLPPLRENTNERGRR